MSSWAATQAQQTPGVVQCCEVELFEVEKLFEPFDDDDASLNDATSLSRSQLPASHSAGNAVKYLSAFHSCPLLPVSLQTRTHWTKRAA